VITGHHIAPGQVNAVVTAADRWHGRCEPDLAGPLDRLVTVLQFDRHGDLMLSHVRGPERQPIIVAETASAPSSAALVLAPAAMKLTGCNRLARRILPTRQHAPSELADRLAV